MAKAVAISRCSLLTDWLIKFIIMRDNFFFIPTIMTNKTIVKRIKLMLNHNFNSPLYCHTAMFSGRLSFLFIFFYPAVKTDFFS
ncbi:hypothetical protein BK025_17660 [Sodalis sp. TME1]|nr:hypothetical protein BK025_17660 [Sodalis sp. TME1]